MRSDKIGLPAPRRLTPLTPLGRGWRAQTLRARRDRQIAEEDKRRKRAEELRRPVSARHDVKGAERVDMNGSSGGSLITVNIRPECISIHQVIDTRRWFVAELQS